MKENTKFDADNEIGADKAAASPHLYSDTFPTSHSASPADLPKNCDTSGIRHPFGKGEAGTGLYR